MKKSLMFFLLLAASCAHASDQMPSALVEYREVEQTYRVEGLVEATRQSTVSAQISGRIKEINFDVGDHVRKGQVILRIDERETAQELAGSNAQVVQAQAALQNAKADYERAKQLFEQKFISQSALDKAQTEYQVARAQAAASEAGAGQASLAHAYSVVVAPYSGIVAARLVEVGEVVSPGKPLMTGFDPSGMRVVVSVPQHKLSDIGSPPKAMVEVPSTRRWIRAASIMVQPLADVRTHSMTVRVNLPANEAGVQQRHVTAEQPVAGAAAGHLLPNQMLARTVSGVYPGMFVQVHFVVGKANKLVMPDSAVLHRSEVVGVYVIGEKGGVKLRQVRVGEPTAEGFIEVLAGLNQGEKVALDPVKAGMRQKTVVNERN